MKINLSKFTKSFLEKCENDLYVRLIKKIKQLSNEPFPHDCKRIKGVKEKVFRVRVGDYRIIIDILDDIIVIFVIEVKHRKNVYK